MRVIKLRDTESVAKIMSHLSCLQLAHSSSIRRAQQQVSLLRDASNDNSELQTLFFVISVNKRMKQNAVVTAVQRAVPSYGNVYRYSNSDNRIWYSRLRRKHCRVHYYKLAAQGICGSVCWRLRARVIQCGQHGVITLVSIKNSCYISITLSKLQGKTEHFYKTDSQKFCGPTANIIWGTASTLLVIKYKYFPTQLWLHCYQSDEHQKRRQSSGGFCASTATRRPEPINFRQLVYKVSSYFKRDAGAICKKKINK